MIKWTSLPKFSLCTVHKQYYNPHFDHMPFVTFPLNFPKKFGFIKRNNNKWVIKTGNCKTTNKKKIDKQWWYKKNKQKMLT